MQRGSCASSTAMKWATVKCGNTSQPSDLLR
ncbi:hypothetical protein VbVaMValp1_12 [Vibrio phage Vb_VaM_Valp1]